MKMKTKPSVFIIESNNFEDEWDNRKEGLILTEILRMLGKEPEYRYIRTKKELKEMLYQFGESKMRYLHLACHGSSKNFNLTMDKVPFNEFAEMANPYLKDKRLFISVCRVTNKYLARAVFPNIKCYSIIGPKGDILFSDAAIMWASFYNLIFKKNELAMQRSNIKQVLKSICKTFGVTFRYYSRTNTEPYFRFNLIRGK